MKGWKDNNCLTGKALSLAGIVEKFSNIILDINECIEGTHLCEESCENTNGSYTCICNDKNRILANDKMNCLGNNNFKLILCMHIIIICTDL